MLLVMRKGIRIRALDYRWAQTNPWIKTPEHWGDSRKIRGGSRKGKRPHPIQTGERADRGALMTCSTRAGFVFCGGWDVCCFGEETGTAQRGTQILGDECGIRTYSTD